MTRVLVTGGSGFIGEAVLRHFAMRGIDAIALGRRAPSESNVPWRKADLLGEDVSAQLRDIAPTHLLHLAWEATPGYYRTAPENALWLQATMRLAKSFAGSGGQHIIFAGSCAEYRPVPADSLENFDEYHAAAADDCAYAITKRQAEEQLAAFAAEAGLRFTSGRIFYIYGPGEPAAKLVSAICRGLAEGMPVPLSEGADVVDYIYKEDVAAALAALTLSAARGPINIGSGDGIRVREIAEMLGAAAGRMDLLAFGKIATSRPPVRIVAATKRLTQELGFSPATPLDQGLAACYDFWRKTLAQKT